MGLVFVVVSNYFRILQPQAVRYAMDTVIDNLYLYKTFEGFESRELLYADIAGILLFFGGLTLAFALLMGLFMYFMRQTIIVMSRLIERDLRDAIFAQYQRLNVAFYKRSNTGDLMARATEDVGKVRMYLGPAVMYTINLVASSVMIIYVMIQVNPTLSLYALIPLPLLSLSIYVVNRRINRQSAAIQAQLSSLNSIAQEVYSGIRVVKAYTQEQPMAAHFGQQCEVYKQKSLALAKTDAFFRPLMLLLIGASTIITVYVGGLLAMDGSVTAGNIAEFVIYVNMLTWPIISVGWVASITQQAAASQKRINEFLKQKPEIAPDPSKPERPVRGRIEFRNVRFVYPDTGICALDNVSFVIEPGERIAITGKTGAGKTSIADLLLRLYDPTEGEILLDGIPLREYNLDQLRRVMGYIPQDVFLFSDTVAANIAFAAPQAEREQIENYAQYASVRDEILGLPQGFDTVIGERGVTLSGGQKQRISIARALIKQPQVLLLDDCLSAVDTKTEAHITRSLQTLAGDKTTIVITHRFYTALRFDRILVLEQGKLTESGTHEELLQKGGYYRDLYEMQQLEMPETEV